MTYDTPCGKKNCCCPHAVKALYRDVKRIKNTRKRSIALKKVKQITKLRKKSK